MSWVDLDNEGEKAAGAFMTQVAALPLPPSAQPPSAPLASQIWWKAQLLRRWDAERQVTAPLDFMQPVELVAGVAGVVILLYRSLPFVF